MTEYEYVVVGVGTAATRHDAVGKRALFGGGDIVPVAAECVTRPHRYPEHLGNQHYGDRDYLATTHGAVRIHHEALVRHRDGARQEVVESSWEADCPVCYRTHRTDSGRESDRPDIIAAVLECCGAEWFAPSDWVEDCDVCGDDHRERHDCTAVMNRQPFPGVDEDYECVPCGWHGPGDDLQAPMGECPDCESRAVRVRA